MLFSPNPSLQGTLLINPDFMGDADDNTNLNLAMDFIKVLNFMFTSYGHKMKISISWSQGNKVIQPGPEEGRQEIKHLVNLAFIDFENCNYLVNPTCTLIARRKHVLQNA